MIRACTRYSLVKFSIYICILCIYIGLFIADSSVYNTHHFCHNWQTSVHNQNDLTWTELKYSIGYAVFLCYYGTYINGAVTPGSSPEDHNVSHHHQGACHSQHYLAPTSIRTLPLVRVSMIGSGGMAYYVIGRA